MIFRLLLFIFFFSFVWVSSIYSDVDNEREVLENLIGIADFYYEQKNLELSLNYYNFAIKLAFKLDDKKSLHFLFSRIGDIYYHIGNSLKALDSYYSAYSISIKAKNNKWIVGDIIRLAKLHLLTSQYKIANRYINKALEIAEKEKYRNEIVESLLVLANIQLFWGDYDKAVQIAERVLEIADNDMQLARAYIRLGKAWYYKGDYEKASLFLDNAKKLSSQKPVFFVVYLYKGLIYEREKDFEKAIAFLEKAMKLIEGSPYKEKIMLYRKLAFLYKAKKDYENALVIYKKLYDITREKEYIDSIIAINYALYRKYERDFDVDKLWKQIDTIHYYAKKKKGNIKDIIDIINKKAKLLLLVNNNKKAYSYAMVSYKLAKRIKKVIRRRYRRRIRKRIKYEKYYKGLVYASLNIAHYYINVGNKKKTKFWFKKAYSYAKKGKLLYVYKREKRFLNLVMDWKRERCNDIVRVNVSSFSLLYQVPVGFYKAYCFFVKKDYLNASRYLKYVKGAYKPEGVLLSFYIAYKTNDLNMMVSLMEDIDRFYKNTYIQAMYYEKLGIMYYRELNFEKSFMAIDKASNQYKALSLYPNYILSSIRKSLILLKLKRYKDSIDTFMAIKPYILKNLDIIKQDGFYLEFLYLSELFMKGIERLPSDLKSKIAPLTLLLAYVKNTETTNNKKLIAYLSKYRTLLSNLKTIIEEDNPNAKLLAVVYTIYKYAKNYSSDYEKWLTNIRRHNKKELSFYLFKRLIVAFITNEGNGKYKIEWTVKY